MKKITVLMMPEFKRIYKKLHAREKKIVDDAVAEIVKNPKIGNQKKGDLSKIHVYKFKVNVQQYLLSYKWDTESRLLLSLGTHENFYRDLKKYL